MVGNLYPEGGGGFKGRRKKDGQTQKDVLKLSSLMLVSKDKLTSDLHGNVHTDKQTNVSMTKTPSSLEFCSVDQGCGHSPEPQPVLGYNHCCQQPIMLLGNNHSCPICTMDCETYEK